MAAGDEITECVAGELFSGAAGVAVVAVAVEEGFDLGVESTVDACRGFGVDRKVPVAHPVVIPPPSQAASVVEPLVAVGAGIGVEAFDQARHRATEHRQRLIRGCGEQVVVFGVEAVEHLAA